MFLDNLVAGTGYLRYRLVLPDYLLNNKINLNGWSDNSNSYYLGILAETGLIGAFGWLISIFNLKVNFQLEYIQKNHYYKSLNQY
jgi:hypothetical protein